MLDLIEANPFELIDANPFILQFAIPSRVSYPRSWIQIYVFVNSDPDPDSALFSQGFMFIPVWRYFYIILQILKIKKVIKKSQNRRNQGFT